MFISKISLPRRTFLRGVGAALGLPLLDAMVPALSAIADTPASPARRLGFIYMPNGVAMNVSGIDYWTPRGLGKNFELSTILTPLAPFRDRLRQAGIQRAQHFTFEKLTTDRIPVIQRLVNAGRAGQPFKLQAA